MVIRRLSTAMFTVLVGWLLFSPTANAANFSGPWATDASACKNIFVRIGGTVSFAKDSDFYGSGFIIEPNRIRGKMATCTIKLRKEDGAVTNFIAVCSTDIALQTVQFSLKIDDENTITRLYPGVPALATKYYRCSLP
jgi:hypothetical protein